MNLETGEDVGITEASIQAGLMRNREFDELIKFLFRRWAAEHNPPPEGMINLARRIFYLNRCAVSRCGDFSVSGNEPEMKNYPVRQE